VADVIPGLRFVEAVESNWQAHPRFAGVLIQKLITSSDTPYASANRVRVPPGCRIGFHTHENQVEMVYVLSGQAELAFSGQEKPFGPGQMVAIPAGLEHSLINRGSENVEILTIFTPPQ
jgi:quercetin dioxygenase-like cupin family protein